VGNGFSAEPTQLWKDAHMYLGGLVQDLEASREKLLATGGRYADSFDGGGDLFTSIEQYWSDTHHYLTRVLEDNIVNLQASEKALKEIADRYGKNDQEVADWLKGIGS
jgi:hypothetical protein